MRKRRGRVIGVHETGEIFNSIKELAEDWEIYSTNIVSCIKNKKPLHGLHIFYYDVFPYCIHCGINLDESNWYDYPNKAKHWVCKTCFIRQQKCNKKNISLQDLENLYEEQNNICLLCGDRLSPTCHIDHKIPIKLGGKSEISNLQLLCKKCNIGKYSWPQKDYIKHCIKVAKYSLAIED